MESQKKSRRTRGGGESETLNGGSQMRKSVLENPRFKGGGRGSTKRRGRRSYRKGRRIIWTPKKRNGGRFRDALKKKERATTYNGKTA